MNSPTTASSPKAPPPPSYETFLQTLTPSASSQGSNLQASSSIQATDDKTQEAAAQRLQPSPTFDAWVNERKAITQTQPN